MKALFLSAPESQIDPAIKPLIAAWDDPPTALQVLHVLDEIVQYGAASGFVVTALDTVMRSALQREEQTLEQLVAQAHWRQPAS